MLPPCRKTVLQCAGAINVVDGLAFFNFSRKQNGHNRPLKFIGNLHAPPPQVRSV